MEQRIRKPSARNLLCRALRQLHTNRASFNYKERQKELQEKESLSHETENGKNESGRQSVMVVKVVAEKSPGIKDGRPTSGIITGTL